MAVSTTRNSLLVLFDEELFYSKPISSDLCEEVQYKMAGVNRPFSKATNVG